MKTATLCLYALIIALSPIEDLSGQETRAAMLLDLKQIHAEYVQAKGKHELAELQFGAGSLTKDELRNAETALLRAEINYQKHLINILSQSVYLTIEEAVKYADSNGQPRVALRIRSALQGNQEFLERLNEVFSFSPVDFQPDRLYDVYVSLADLDSDMIISKPYEIHVPSLEFGQEIKLDFGLLRDAEGLQVLMVYLGNTSAKRIWLEKEAGSSLVSIDSVQFSQDANLGGHATFDLVLERVTQTDEIVQLVVINLPRQITYEIYETGTQVRSTQIKLTPAASSRKLSLRVHLPDRTNDRILLNESLEFFVAAVPQSETVQIERTTIYNNAELLDMGVGMVRLELFPRGVGSMEIRAPSLYFELSSDEGVDTEIEVVNDGTIPLVNVRVVSDAPIGWTVDFDPEVIDELSPAQGEKVSVSLRPPLDSGIGAQEISVQAEALAEGNEVESNQKIIRMVMRKEMAVGTIVLLALLIIVVVSAIVIFGVKISRR